MSREQKSAVSVREACVLPEAAEIAFSTRKSSSISLLTCNFWGFGFINEYVIFMVDISQFKLLKELDLLVSTGVGVAPIAPALSSVLSKIVGAESYGLCWFDATGLPQGFYQQGAPRESEELFMNHYKELFMGPHEYTPFWSSHHKGRCVGNSLRTSKEYFRSNTYNLLIKPSHCHFLLDAHIDLDGITRLTACFFRAADNPFTPTDEKKLASLIPVLRRAISKQAHEFFSYRSQAQTGYMLVSNDGRHMEMLDAYAQKLLATVKLFDQNVSLTQSSAMTPRFVQQLCERLRAERIDCAEMDIEMAGGALRVGANRLDMAFSSSPAVHNGLPAIPKIVVSLQFIQAGAMEIVHRITAWGLSPLQARIAMYAASGGSRMQCAVHHRVSKEALKKHLRQILAASNCTDWQELSQTLGAP